MQNSKFNTKEAIAIVLTVAIAHSLLSLPKNLITNQKSAVLLNIIFVTFIALCFVYIIYRLLKKFSGKDIIDVSEFFGGKKLKIILGIIFISYISFSASIFLRNFCECIKVVYFPNTKVNFIITLFIMAIILACSLDYNANIKTNYIIMPIVLISIILLFVFNLKNFTVDRMFPIFGNGIVNTFVTGIGNIYAFGGIIFLYFLPPLLKEPQHFKKISILSIIISALYILITVSIILFMFAYFVNVDEIMPLFSAARNIEFGSFFQRLESIFLLIWLIIIASYVSIAMTFCLGIFKKITNTTDSKPLVLPFGLLFLGISMFPKNYAFSYFLETHIYPLLNIGIVFVLPFILLLLANIKSKKLKKRGERYFKV